MGGKKVAIYDPALCCSTGLCGPVIDPVLIKVNDTVLALKKQGVEVERFNLSQQIKDFTANEVVAELLRKNGKKILPITMVNGSIVKTGAYPSYEDICKSLDIEPLQHKPMTLSVQQ